MIKNIIFDIGGVLLDYNPKTYLDKLNIEDGKRKELNDIIFHNQKWKDCLNGFITNKELIEYLVKENLKYKNEIEQILSKDNLKYMLPPKQEMIEYYKSLKQKKYKIYLCSNITKDTYDYIKDNFEIIQIADGGVFSCFENISKPSVEIYNRLIRKYQIDVEKSLFIDDTNKNTITANEIGFKTIVFKDIEQIKNIEKINKLEIMLKSCYSKDTCYPKYIEKWNINNPTCGQCAITALIVQEYIGGTIHKIRIQNNETHYFNIINKNIYDFTKEQFDLENIAIRYESNELISREQILENENTNKRYKILKQKLEKLK